MRHRVRQTRSWLTGLTECVGRAASELSTEGVRSAGRSEQGQEQRPGPEGV
jgi:hypothetical protein